MKIIQEILFRIILGMVTLITASFASAIALFCITIFFIGWIPYLVYQVVFK